jgi:radical SAM superfamily enzyme YgiQ (UPF0313 family)
MNPRPKIYLADLRHTAGGVVSNSHMPLGIGYMKAVMDRDLPAVQCRTFAYPDHLLETLKSDPPDVMFFSNYIWNERLSRHFTNVIKSLRPESLVVVGGPNIPFEKERQVSFFQSWDNLDVYALGEGDFLATEIVNRFLDADKSVAKLANNGIPSSVYRLGGQVVHEPSWDRNLDLEKSPSPWLGGAQDHFFDGKLIPMIETNRGCPFKCTFCVQGSDYYNRVAHAPKEQVMEDLTYIARRIKNVSPDIGSLSIADPNFAMYKRDVDISTHIGKLQKDYGWPNFIDASTGKNAPDLVIKSVEETNGALEMLHAVQSMDDTVLKSIKRSNIKVDTYSKVTEHLNSKGMRTFSQMILGLPQETLQSHITGLNRLVDEGIDSMQNFQLVLLKGCEMESQNDRDEFGFKTGFRLSPRGFGNYDGNAVFDVEEAVISTNTLSYDDYIQARKYHIGYGIIWSQDWFNDFFYYAKNLGIKFSDCTESIVEEMDSDEGVVGEIISDFIKETEGELFQTPEACAEFYSKEDNFKKLQVGEIGENLMNKYRAIASFWLWSEVCKLASKVIKKLIIARAFNQLDPEFDQFWEDLYCYVDAKHASGSSVDEILTPVSLQLQYDIPQWMADGHPNSLAPYKLETPQNFLFKLSETGSRELKKAMDTFAVDLLGLAKVVRNVKVSCQVRQAQKI